MGFQGWLSLKYQVKSTRGISDYLLLCDLRASIKTYVKHLQDFLMIQLEPKRNPPPPDPQPNSNTEKTRRETDGSIIKSSNYGTADPDPKNES
jgi:hypothetical protein